MRIALKILKILAVSALSLAVLTLLAAVTILLRPEWVLRPSVLSRLAPLAGGLGYPIQWQSMRSEVKSFGLLHKAIDLEFKGLCFGTRGNAQQGCFGRLRMAGEFEWDDGFKIRSLGPLIAEAATLRMQLPESKAEETPASKEWDLPEWLRQARLQNIDLQFASLSIRQGQSLISGALRIRAVPQGERDMANLSIGGEGICVESQQPKISGCLNFLWAAGEMGWQGGPLRLLELGPVYAESRSIVAEWSSSLPEEQSSPGFQVPRLVLPELFRGTRFLPAFLNFPDVSVTLGDHRLKGALSLSVDPGLEGGLQALRAETDLSVTPGVGQLKSSLKLSSDSKFLENDWHFQADSQLQGPGLSGNAQVTLYPSKNQSLAYSLDGEFHQGKLFGHLSGSGELQKEHYSIRFSGKTGGFHPKVHSVAMRACAAGFRQTRADGAGKLSMDCPLHVDLTPLSLPSAAGSRQITLPNNFDIRVKTDLDTILDPSFTKPVAGTLELILTPITEDLFRLKGRTFTRFSGVPKHYPQGWDIRSDVDLFAELMQFQKLAKQLHKTAYPIPAPLEVLAGNVEIGISGQADIGKKSGNFPVTFKTRLKSEKQSFDTDGTGVLRYAFSDDKYQGNLDLDLVLPELKLSLPHLGLASLPELLPDPRMNKPWLKPPKPSSGDLHYRVTLKTPQDKPALLSSNFAKTDIPIALDLRMEDGKAGGTLTIGESALRFFRREAQIQEIKLSLADPPDRSGVVGVIRVPYVDYKIDIQLFGTVERPRIIFQSDPPLSQEQILSYLIYGREFEELDTDKTDSVGNVAAAFSDRAVALGSLFLLASTPIQSVSYNPATQNFSAKIRLAEGTSLTLGTTEGKTQQVGIRKNIGGNWIVNTYIENDSEQGEQRGGAFLEYYKRY